jgi:hypothetical protein
LPSIILSLCSAHNVLTPKCHFCCQVYKINLSQSKYLSLRFVNFVPRKQT